MNPSIVFIALLLNFFLTYCVAAIAAFAFKFFQCPVPLDSVLAVCIVINACAWILARKKG